MSSETITVKARFCGSDLVRAVNVAALAFAEAGVRVADLFGGKVPRHLQEKRREQRRFAALTKRAEDDPHLHVELRTGADGVCRVVAKRLGDWGCDCKIHRQRRRRMFEAAEQAVEMTRSFDRAMQSVTRDACAGPAAIRKLEDQALKLAGDGAVGGSNLKGALVELAPVVGNGAVPGESDAGPGAGLSPPTITGTGIASPDQTTAGDGVDVPGGLAPGQGPCGPESASTPSRAVARPNDERSST